MAPTGDVAMDVSASLHCDVSSGGGRPACSTACSGVDVVYQQQLRSAALQLNECSQPSSACSWPAVSPHHTPGLLLGCGVVWGSVVVQRIVGGVDRADH